MQVPKLCSPVAPVISKVEPSKASRTLYVPVDRASDRFGHHAVWLVTLHVLKQSTSNVTPESLANITTLPRHDVHTMLNLPSDDVVLAAQTDRDKRSRR